MSSFGESFIWALSIGKKVLIPFLDIRGKKVLIPPRIPESAHCDTCLSHYKVFSAQHGISTSKVNLEQVPANSRKPTAPHPAQQSTGQRHSDLSGTAPSLPHKGSPWNPQTQSSCRPHRCFGQGCTFMLFSTLPLPVSHQKANGQRAGRQHCNGSSQGSSTLLPLQPRTRALRKCTREVRG